MLAALAGTALLAVAPRASADEALKLGKSVPQAFGFAPLDVGIEKGIFKKNGVDVEAVDLGRAPRLARGLISMTIDMALGSGPDMANIVKGAPISRPQSAVELGLLDKEPDMKTLYTEQLLPK